MRRLFTPALLLTGLVACRFGPPPSTDDDPDTSVTDTQPIEDTATDTAIEPQECEPEPVSGLGFDTGDHVLSIDSELFNNCENQAGKGLHIHVGEDQIMHFDQDQSCVDAISDPGGPTEMRFAGTTDGSTAVVDGRIVLEFGTCHVRIDATLTAQMKGQSDFSYRMDAVADIHEELSPDACQLIIGETENHTFPALPCDQAWTGKGRLAGPE